MLAYEYGDRRRIYLACDAEDCPNRLEGGLSAERERPSPVTGWITVQVEGERRNYCVDQAQAAAA